MFSEEREFRYPTNIPSKLEVESDDTRNGWNVKLTWCYLCSRFDRVEWLPN